MRTDTLKELCRLISLELRSHGSSRLAESLKRSFETFNNNYQVADSDRKLNILLEFQSTFNNHTTSLKRLKSWEHIADLIKKMNAELSRLITTGQNNQIEFKQLMKGFV